MNQLIRQNQTIHARALLLGSKIDIKSFKSDEVVAINPLTIAVPGGGYATVFRYGVVVFFGLTRIQEKSFLDRLESLTGEPKTWPEDEVLTIQVDPDQREGIDAQGNLWLQDGTIQRFQLVSEILARSEVLSDDELNVSKTFDRIEPLITNLSKGRGPSNSKELLRYIGDSLMSQERMVGRAEVSDKPDVLWEKPELEGLYLKLEDEFDLKDRHMAIERKLQVISNTAETLLDLLQAKQNLRVEYYIVGLIVFEIILTLYDMFFVKLFSS